MRPNPGSVPKMRARVLTQPRYSPEQLEEIRRIGEEIFVERDLRVLRRFAVGPDGHFDDLLQEARREVLRTSRRSLGRYFLLRQMVEALGGTLEVEARFGDKRVHLSSL